MDPVHSQENMIKCSPDIQKLPEPQDLDAAYNK